MLLLLLQLVEHSMLHYRSSLQQILSFIASLTKIHQVWGPLSAELARILFLIKLSFNILMLQLKLLFGVRFSWRLWRFPGTFFVFIAIVLVPGDLELFFLLLTIVNSRDVFLKWLIVIILVLICSNRAIPELLVLMSASCSGISPRLQREWSSLCPHHLTTSLLLLIFTTRHYLAKFF